MTESDRPASPPVRRAGCARWVFGFSALAVLALVGWLWWIARQHDAEMLALEADLDAADPGWRMEQIEAARATPPPGRNSAEQVERVKALLPKDWAERKAAGTAKQDPEKEGATEDPAGNDLLAAIAEVPVSQRLPGPLVAEVKAKLAATQPAWEAALLLADMPQGSFPTKGKGHMRDSSHLGDIRSVAAYVQMGAICQAEANQPALAMRAFHALLNTGRATSDETHNLSCLVRGSINALAGKVLERLLSSVAFTDADLTGVQAALEREIAAPIFLNAMRDERASVHQLVKDIENGKASLAIPDQPPSGMLHGIGERMMTRAYRVDFLRLLTRSVAIARLPIEQQLAATRALQQDPQTTQVMPLLWLPAFVKLNEAHLREQAKLRCALTAVAVKRYRLAKGQWPAHLDDVAAAGLLPAVPIDPLGSGPLRYRRTDTGVLIYSVGFDGQDDGGAADKDPQKPGTDLVFWLKP